MSLGEGKTLRDVLRTSLPPAGKSRLHRLRGAVQRLSAAREGREVATKMMRAAADELVRIAPDDPIAGAVLAGFQRADSARAAGAGNKQRVVWF